MSRENVELIERSFAEWDLNGEPPWHLLHPDVVVADHDILDAGDYRGIAGVRRWLEDWSAAWSDFTMEPEEFIDAGEHVVAVLRMKATGRGSSVSVERQDAIVYAVADGKIARLDYFNNRAQAFAAAGLADDTE